MLRNIVKFLLFFALFLSKMLFTPNHATDMLPINLITRKMLLHPFSSGTSYFSSLLLLPYQCFRDVLLPSSNQNFMFESQVEKQHRIQQFPLFFLLQLLYFVLGLWQKILISCFCKIKWSKKKNQNKKSKGWMYFYMQHMLCSQRRLWRGPPRHWQFSSLMWSHKTFSLCLLRARLN